jgi:alginate O-acetyltransferase complex protein AlgI
MNFTSYEFVLFFAVIVLACSCLRKFSVEKWFLLAASCAFYASWSVPCLFLILFTAVSDYAIARKMARLRDDGSRRRLLVISLVCNLGLLGFFKYANFFLDNIGALLHLAGWHAGPWHLNIILPPAISFYTFASLSYVLDVYYERIPACESARDYALFITFFPKLLSGPIVRARELLPQFQTRPAITSEDVEVGLSYFLVGAVKKLVIADQVAPHVNLIFGAPAQYDGLTLILAALGYAVQIYCDFSGYTDMAIGCGRIMGFKFPDNFKMPYSSGNITEFWRRWHITLSQWFRDYLFLPLEIATRNNPSAMLRVSINMMITMLLCGLWHGASWTFVIWGGIHGTALAVHKVWTVKNPLAAQKNNAWFQFLWVGFAHLLTLGVVVLSLVFFRAQSVSDAAVFLGRAFSLAHDGTRLVSPYILAAVTGVFLVHLIVRKDRNFAEELPRFALVPRLVGYAGLFFLLVVLGATDSAPFIYFQF